MVFLIFLRFFFKDLIYFDKSGNQEKYLNNVHLGMVVDTYLITSKDYKVDIRWNVLVTGLPVRTTVSIIVVMHREFLKAY